MTVWHNTFSEICEDGVMIWGCKDCDFQYNLWINSRGISLEASRAFGWSRSEPVHQDFFQIACNAPSQYVDGLVISNNEMYDDTGRVHGVLLNNKLVSDSPAAYAATSRHRRVVVDNNFLSQTHTTGMQLTNVVNLKARRNKIHRSATIPGSSKNDVAMIFGAWGDQASTQDGRMDDVTVEDNVSRKFVGRDNNPSWTVSGNVTSNDISVLGTGWVEMRQAVAPPGAARTGAYGAVGPDVPPPPPETRPPQLEAGDWSFVDIAPNPDIPGTFVGVIGIPMGSEAYDATVVHWLSNPQNTRPTTYEGLHADGTTRLWKMAGGALEPHSKLPGQTSDPIRVSYRLDGITDRSLDSANAETYTVPADPGQGTITPITTAWDWTVVGEVRYRPAPEDLPVGLVDQPQGFEIVAARFRPTEADPAQGHLIWKSDDYVAYEDIVLVGHNSLNSLEVPNPNNPSPYVAGDYISALAFRSGPGAITPPGGIWSAEAAFSDSLGMAASLIGTVAAGYPAESPASVFTAPDGRTMAVSLGGVDPADPTLAVATAAVAIGATGPFEAQVPALQLGGVPSRLVLFVCNRSSTIYPATISVDGVGFTLLRNHGGSPRVWLYLSDAMVEQDFAGGTALGDSGGNTLVVALALRPKSL